MSGRVSEQKQDVPSLRFRMRDVSSAEAQKHGEMGGLIPSFAMSWNKKRLGEIFDERQSRSTYGELLSVTMSSGIISAKNNGRYDNSSIENGNYKVVRIGDIAYNSMRMWQGACGASPYDGLVSPAYTVIVPKEDVDSIFFEYAFKLPKTLHAFRTHSQGLTSDTWNLKFPLFSQVQISLPSFPEQQKIGSFFRSLDALINGREKALGKLESLKKAMLQKMFPQGDSKTPELRFKGFEGDWKLYRFDEVFQHVPSKAYQIRAEEYLGAGRYPVVDQGQLPIVGYSNNATRVCKARENPVVVFGDHTRIVKYVDFDFVVGADGTQLLRASDHDLMFLTEVICGLPLPNMGYSRHYKYLQESIFLLPDLFEQKKIGAYFRSLDALSAARREEVTKLRDLKKALLERMFV